MVSLDREEIKKCEDGGNSAITQKSQPSSRIRRLNYTAVHNNKYKNGDRKYKNSDRLALKCARNTAGRVAITRDKMFEKM